MAAGLSLAGGLRSNLLAAFTPTAPSATPAAAAYTMDLCPGRIGVGASQDETVRLAEKHGFGSVEPMTGFLLSLGDKAQEYTQQLKRRGLVWGAAGLSVDFRSDASVFDEGMKRLPSEAAALEKAGVTRVGTWLRPNHAELTYVQNFRQHARRLKQIARVYGDHGIRFGLEYVGPFTLWSSAEHSFVHTMAETKDLIAEIGEDNVGFVLDSWHWYCAEETAADILTLDAKDVVAVDLNDAPKGRTLKEQIDSQRELPAATGVIDVATFLKALQQIGYDGPIRAEPFNKPLNALDDEPAVEKTAAAISKAFALAE